MIICSYVYFSLGNYFDVVRVYENGFEFDFDNVNMKIVFFIVKSKLLELLLCFIVVDREFF